MKKLLILITILTLVLSMGVGCAKPTTNDQIYYPTTDEWLFASPANQQMDATTLNEIGTGISDLNFAIDSVVVLRNGYIVYEDYRTLKYDETTVHPIYSVTKSVLGALVGIAINEGAISLQTKVMDYYKDRTIQNMDQRKQNITVQNLLEMKGGLQWNEWALPYSNPNNVWIKALNSGDSIQYVLDQPMASEPGTTWSYCGGYSYMLADILEKATGKDILTYATEKIFQPLGITNVKWNKDKSGKYEAAGGLNLTARDMAKFGLLILRQGQWEDKQIIPADYIAAATTSHHATSSTTGYGYESWWTATKESYYYCNGIYGQRIYVVPNENIVVVFACAIPDPDRETQLRALVTKYVVGACITATTTANK